jgi:AraC-like DNA-binding protein
MSQEIRTLQSAPPLPAGNLTETSRFRLTYLPVPPPLAEHVTTFYHFCCDERDIRDIQPAAVGHLAVFPYGEGAIHFRDGRSDASHEVNLLTPFSVAAPFTVTGPFHAIGAALTPLGWCELTGMSASEHANRFYRAGDHLGEEITHLGAAWSEAYRAGEIDGAGLAVALGEYIQAQLNPLPPAHRQLIGRTMLWLAGAFNPAIDELYADSRYSRRQTQRLVERYFGLPPTALRRKYRALRAAAMLARPDLDDATETAIRECFYDQPHLIREVRLFVGRTPSRLSDEPDSYLTEMLDLRNLRELDPSRAPLTTRNKRNRLEARESAA